MFTHCTSSSPEDASILRDLIAAQGNFDTNRRLRLKGGGRAFALLFGMLESSCDPPSCSGGMKVSSQFARSLHFLEGCCEGPAMIRRPSHDLLPSHTPTGRMRSVCVGSLGARKALQLGTCGASALPTFWQCIKYSCARRQNGAVSKVCKVTIYGRSSMLSTVLMHPHIFLLASVPALSPT